MDGLIERNCPVNDRCFPASFTETNALVACEFYCNGLGDGTNVLCGLESIIGEDYEFCDSGPSMPRTNMCTAMTAFGPEVQPEDLYVVSIVSPSDVDINVAGPGGRADDVPVSGELMLAGLNCDTPPCPFTLWAGALQLSTFDITILLSTRTIEDTVAMNNGPAVGTIDGAGGYSVPAAQLSQLWIRAVVDGDLTGGEGSASSPLTGNAVPDADFFTAVGSFSSDGSTLDLDLQGVFTQRPPVASAGLDQTIECTGPDGALVVLDGSASFDPDGNPTQFVWLVDGTPVLEEGDVVTVQMGLGSHIIELIVSDFLSTDHDTSTVEIVDTTPPSVSKGDPLCLFPPMHRLAHLSTSDTSVFPSFTDLCDPSPAVTIISATSSEPDDALGVGDGHTTGDVRFDEDNVCVRAERDGTGDGREYLIEVEATDAFGNSATGTVTVLVPHDRGGIRCEHVPPTSLVDDDDPLCALPSASTSIKTDAGVAGAALAGGCTVVCGAHHRGEASILLFVFLVTGVILRRRSERRR